MTLINLLLLVQTLEGFLGLVSIFVAFQVLSLVRESKRRKVSILLLIRVLHKNTFCLLLQLELLLLMLVLIVEVSLGFGGSTARNFVSLPNPAHHFGGLWFGGLANINILAIVVGIGGRPLSVAPNPLNLLFFKRSALFLILLKRKQNGSG